MIELRIIFAGRQNSWARTSATPKSEWVGREKAQKSQNQKQGMRAFLLSLFATFALFRG